MKLLIKTAALTLLLTVSTTLFAQETDKKNELLDIIAKETCECVSNKNMDFSKIERSKLELEFGMCIMESYSKRRSKVEKYLGVSLDNERSLERLGEDVAFKMMNHCSPVILSLAGQYVEEDYAESEEDQYIVGEVVELSTSKFNTLNIKDESKRIQKFLWLEFFNGEDLLKDFDSLKGKIIKIYFVEKEFFDPVISEYRNFKIIKEIMVL